MANFQKVQYQAHHLAVVNLRRPLFRQNCRNGGRNFLVEIHSNGQRYARPS
jgi:hypothetical protein